MAGSELCRRTLPLTQSVLGILLPTLLSIWVWKPDDARQARALECSLVKCMLCQASRTCAAADRALHFAFQGRRSDMPHPLFLSWLLLVCCWLWWR